MEIRIHKDDSDKTIGLLMAISKEFPEHTHDLLQLTRSAPNGLTVEILPLTFERSRPQEKYYRKWCAEFGNFCGLPPDKMHEEMLSECFGSDNVSTPFGWRRIPHKRSADASRVDYSDLIETLCRIAAEYGFVIPPPQKKAE